MTDEVPWHPRDGAGACVFRGRMWLLGGWNHQEPLNFSPEEGSNCAQVWSSADGRAWRLELARAPWPPRHLSGFLVHEDEMWLVGGDNGSGYYQKDVWKSGDGLHWECVLESAPWPDRASHIAASFDGKLWIMGGQGNAPKWDDFRENVADAVATGR